jgi:hypothetical protein
VEILKKILVAGWLCIYLLSVTSFGEWLLLPKLVEHFYSHKAFDKNTGIMTFLAMHYCTEDGSDKDTNEDSQLPFKSMETTTAAAYFISITPAGFLEMVSKPSFQINTSFGLYNHLFFTSRYLPAIWQPPRFNDRV